MRLILIAAILLPAYVVCHSKKDNPVFGKVDKADLLSNTCEFKHLYYSPEEYTDLPDFYKKMNTLPDEEIVFKKKEN